MAYRLQKIGNKRANTLNNKNTEKSSNEIYFSASADRPVIQILAQSTCQFSVNQGPREMPKTDMW